MNKQISKIQKKSVFRISKSSLRKVIKIVKVRLKEKVIHINKKFLFILFLPIIGLGLDTKTFFNQSLITSKLPFINVTNNVFINTDNKNITKVTWETFVNTKGFEKINWPLITSINYQNKSICLFTNEDFFFSKKQYFVGKYKKTIEDKKILNTNTLFTGQTPINNEEQLIEKNYFLTGRQYNKFFNTISFVNGEVKNLAQYQDYFLEFDDIPTKLNSIYHSKTKHINPSLIKVKKSNKNSISYFNLNARINFIFKLKNYYSKKKLPFSITRFFILQKKPMKKQTAQKLTSSSVLNKFLLYPSSITIKQPTKLFETDIEKQNNILINKYLNQIRLNSKNNQNLNYFLNRPRLLQYEIYNSSFFFKNEILNVKQSELNQNNLSKKNYSNFFYPANSYLNFLNQGTINHLEFKKALKKDLKQINSNFINSYNLVDLTNNKVFTTQIKIFEKKNWHNKILKQTVNSFDYLVFPKKVIMSIKQNKIISYTKKQTTNLIKTLLPITHIFNTKFLKINKIGLFTSSSFKESVQFKSNGFQNKVFLNSNLKFDKLLRKILITTDSKLETNVIFKDLIFKYSVNLKKSNSQFSNITNNQFLQRVVNQKKLVKLGHSDLLKRKVSGYLYPDSLGYNLSQQYKNYFIVQKSYQKNSQKYFKSSPQIIIYGPKYHLSSEFKKFGSLILKSQNLSLTHGNLKNLTNPFLSLGKKYNNEQSTFFGSIPDRGVPFIRQRDLPINANETEEDILYENLTQDRKSPKTLKIFNSKHGVDYKNNYSYLNWRNKQNVYYQKETIKKYQHQNPFKYYQFDYSKLKLGNQYNDSHLTIYKNRFDYTQNKNLNILTTKKSFRVDLYDTLFSKKWTALIQITGISLILKNFYDINKYYRSRINKAIRLFLFNFEIKSFTSVLFTNQRNVFKVQSETFSNIINNKVISNKFVPAILVLKNSKQFASAFFMTKLLQNQVQVPLKKKLAGNLLQIKKVANFSLPQKQKNIDQLNNQQNFVNQKKGLFYNKLVQFNNTLISKNLKSTYLTTTLLENKKLKVNNENFLLVGPSGVGKTLIIKALSSKTNTHVIVASGENVNQYNFSNNMQNNTEASELKKIFNKAYALSPCIVVLDEIDRFAKKRTTVLTSSSNNTSLSQLNSFNLFNKTQVTNKQRFKFNKKRHLIFRTLNPIVFNNNLLNNFFTHNQSNQLQYLDNQIPYQFDSKISILKNNSEYNLNMLTQLLCLLDGMQTHQNLVVIGTTSNPFQLDTALVRPGRLHNVVFLNLPNKERRIKLLKFNSPFNFDSSINWNNVSSQTNGFSSAELKAVINISSLKGIFDHRQLITTSNPPVQTQKNIEYGLKTIQLKPGMFESELYQFANQINIFLLKKSPIFFFDLTNINNLLFQQVHYNFLKSVPSIVENTAYFKLQKKIVQKCSNCTENLFKQVQVKKVHQIKKSRVSFYIKHKKHLNTLKLLAQTSDHLENLQSRYPTKTKNLISFNKYVLRLFKMHVFGLKLLKNVTSGLFSTNQLNVIKYELLFLNKTNRILGLNSYSFGVPSTKKSNQTLKSMDSELNNIKRTVFYMSGNALMESLLKQKKFTFSSVHLWSLCQNPSQTQTELNSIDLFKQKPLNFLTQTQFENVVLSMIGGKIAELLVSKNFYNLNYNESWNSVQNPNINSILGNNELHQLGLLFQYSIEKNIFYKNSNLYGLKSMVTTNKLNNSITNQKKLLYQVITKFNKKYSQNRVITKKFNFTWDIVSYWCKSIIVNPNYPLNNYSSLFSKIDNTTDLNLIGTGISDNSKPKKSKQLLMQNTYIKNSINFQLKTTNFLNNTNDNVKKSTLKNDLFNETITQSQSKLTTNNYNQIFLMTFFKNLKTNWNSLQLAQSDIVLNGLVFDVFNKGFFYIEENRELLDLFVYYILCKDNLNDSDRLKITKTFGNF